MKGKPVRKSKNGRSVYLDVGVWLDDGTIHPTARSVEGFHIYVTEDPARRDGHPTLYRRLVACLEDAGAPAPELTGARGGAD